MDRQDGRQWSSLKVAHSYGQLQVAHDGRRLLLHLLAWKETPTYHPTGPPTPNPSVEQWIHLSNSKLSIGCEEAELLSKATHTRFFMLNRQKCILTNYSVL